jgi:glyoxylase-like metal-dependent hydrolase (beta-lactamase superfamily II)
VAETNAGREPILGEVGGGITLIDTRMAGFAQLNSVYVVASREPALIEAGSGADGATILAGLERLGLESTELAHLVVTHVHVDHAGGAGALLARFPRATLWIHERGAPHAVDPTRLVASTARTYGEDRMRALYGTTLPCPPDRVRAVADGDVIPLGDRRLEVLYTPGHASHHVALLDDASGALFTGEAIGSHLPWADCYRPALPPPQTDLELALESIRRMRARDPSLLLTSHFGPIAEPQAGFERGAARIEAWAETVRGQLAQAPPASIDELEDILSRQARWEYESDSGLAFDRDRYDAIGSIRMNAEGLARYWKKRWEREAAAAGASDATDG